MGRTPQQWGREGDQVLVAGCHLPAVGSQAGWWRALVGSHFHLTQLPSSRLDSRSPSVAPLPPLVVRATSGWWAEPPLGRWLSGPSGGSRRSELDGARLLGCGLFADGAGCALGVAAASEVPPSLALAAGQLLPLQQVLVSPPWTLSEPPGAPSPGSSPAPPTSPSPVEQQISHFQASPCRPWSTLIGS